MTRLRQLSCIAPLVRGAHASTTRCQLEAIESPAFEAQHTWPWLSSSHACSGQRNYNSSASAISSTPSAASLGVRPSLPASHAAQSLTPLQHHPDQSLHLPLASASTTTSASDPTICSCLPPTETPDVSSLPLVAHTALEDNLALVLSPTQLGVQLWEGVHAASGLPWWASIPAATLAVRLATLPLSLRAYAASSNVALLHRAFGLSGRVAEAVAAAQAQAQERRQSEAQAVRAEEAGEAAAPPSGGGAAATAAAAAGPSSTEPAAKGTAGGVAVGGGSGSSSSGAGSLGRVELVRRVLAHLRAEHKAPSFTWYAVNASVQVPLAVSLTLALRRMSDSLWPGLTGEGLAYFPDLTAPPLYLQTLSTPYGTAGAILPLALVLLYISAVDRSAGASSPGIHTALKLLVLPLYCGALLQPHAVLLYWLTLAASQLGLYQLAARVPLLRRAAGVPDVLLPQAGAAPADGAAAPAAGAAAGDPLDPLLLALAESYSKAGNRAAARSCLQALLARKPDHADASERLRALDAP